MSTEIPVVILCGGFGTRLGDEGKKYPKALIKIGRKPIIFFLIKYLLKKNYNKIFLAAGYKHNLIKKFIKKNKLFSQVRVINTGLKTMTGGRILRLKKYLNFCNKFIVTYGDGLSDINIDRLVKYHEKKGGIATVTAVKSFSNFGELFISKKNRVNKFSEKEYINNRWINGGFFVFDKKIFNFIKSDNDILEKKPLKALVQKKKFFAYKHKSFWKCLDNHKDKIEFNKLITKKKYKTVFIN